MPTQAIDAIYIGDKTTGRSGSYHKPLLKQWQVGEVVYNCHVTKNRKLIYTSDTGVLFRWGNDNPNHKRLIARCDVIDLIEIDGALLIRRKASDRLGGMVDLCEQYEMGEEGRYTVKCFEYGEPFGIRMTLWQSDFTSDEAYVTAYDFLMSLELPRPDWEALHALSFTG